MRVRVGADLVYMPRFRNVLGKIRNKVFSPYELRNLEIGHKSCYGRTVQSQIGQSPIAHSAMGGIAAAADLHLAGLFAAKEAVIKALDLKAGSWLSIEIVNKKSGKPVIKLAKNLSKGKIVSCDLSISHDGKYAMAIFVAFLK